MVCAVVAALAWLLFAGARHASRSASTDFMEDSSGAKDTAGRCDKRCRSVEGRKARALADKMLDITNKYRKEGRMEALAPNESLRRVADEQATYMCSKGVLTHDSPGGELREKMEKNNFRAVNIGENIAKQENAGSYREVARLWRKSSEHRKNILGDFAYSNVSTCLDKAGNRFWVQVFGKNMPNHEIPEIEEIQKLKAYLERGFSGVENDKYIIMLKPGADGKQGGDGRHPLGGFQPMDKNEQARITKKLEDLFKPTAPSRPGRKKNPDHNIINPNENACKSAQDCAPGTTVQPRVFNTDGAYSEAKTIPYLQSSSTEKVPRFVFRDRTSTARCDSEATTLSETRPPDPHTTEDRSSSSLASATPLVIIRTTTNIIYRTVTKVPEDTSSAVTVQTPSLETDTASSFYTRNSTAGSTLSLTISINKGLFPGAGNTPGMSRDGSIAPHTSTTSLFDEGKPSGADIIEDILSGKYPKFYGKKHAERPDKSSDSSFSPKDSEPSKLFIKYFEDLKRLILKAMKKDGPAPQDCAPNDGSSTCTTSKGVWSTSRSLGEWSALSTTSRERRKEDHPPDDNGSSIFVKLSTLLAGDDSSRPMGGTQPASGTTEEANYMPPRTISLLINSDSKTCSSTDYSCMGQSQQLNPRVGTTVSKAEVVRVIGDLLKDNEFKIRILKDEKGLDGKSRIEIARPLLN